MRNSFDLFDAIPFIIIGAVVIIALDLVFSDKVYVGEGIVIEKVYQPATNSVGVASTKDGVNTVVTQNSSSWVLIVKLNEETFDVEVDSHTWGNVEKQNSYPIYRREGLFLNYGYDLQP